MTSYKGDQYYEAHVDDDYYSPSESDELDIPTHMSRLRENWILDNYDELIEIFTIFENAGKQVFGRAFYQLGTIDQFCKFCYKYMQPGAV